MFRDQVGVGTQPIAGAFDLDDDRMVEQAVEECCYDDRITKDLAPFGEAAVGGQDHRTLFVVVIDNWKNRFAPPDVIGR